jgi:undecaprenyl-diphosphatase
VIKEMSSLDSSVFQWINKMSITWDSWNSFMIFAAQNTVGVMAIFLCLTWLFGSKARKKINLQIGLAASLALIIENVSKHYIYRIRPGADDGANILIDGLTSNSFPSLTALLVFSIASMMILHRRVEGTLWMVGAFIGGFAAIWCGVHYPGDVLGAGAIAFFSALIVKTYLPSWTLMGVLLTYILRSYDYLEKQIIRLVRALIVRYQKRNVQQKKR